MTGVSSGIFGGLAPAPYPRHKLIMLARYFIVFFKILSGAEMEIY
jgi:hypothetical protein